MSRSVDVDVLRLGAGVNERVVAERSDAVAILDPLAIRIARSGVESYYWPVRHEEVGRAATTIVDVYRAVLSSPLKAGDEDARLAYAVTALLFMDLLSIFAARLLATRCARDGRHALLPESGAPEWRCALLGEPLDGSRLLKLLPRGLPRPPSWRRLSRPLAGLWRPEFFRRRPVELVAMERDIVSVSPCELTRKRARQLGVRPVYTPLYEWFYPPTADELRRDPLRPMSADLRDHLIAELEDGFLQLGAAPARVPPDMIARLFDEATSWVRFYLRRIEREPKRVPRHLWKGSSGIIWARILADAVQAHGGDVTSHDHAYGANYSEGTIIPFNELQATDIFVTYTQAHADLYRRVGPKLLIGPRMPRVEHVDAQASTGQRADRGEVAAAADRAPRSILYVPSYLASSRTAAMPHMAAPMAYDWQARLLTMLQDLGLAVTQKPHPQSPLPQPPVFEKEFGVTTAHTRFEQIMNDYDVVLFDFPPQTCFGVTVRSNRPMVMIDFGTTTYTPELLTMLERRCAVVPGWFDAENRAQVDPGALASAIARARFLHDPSFAEAIIAL